MPLGLSLSNRLEALREGLLHSLDEAAPSPFCATQIIIPSAAMRRHLELAIADHQGICAGIEFSYLGQWLWRELARYLPAPERSPLDTGPLSWALWQELGAADLLARHPALQAYLAQADALMRYELATRIAQCFDDLLAYRADWAEAWRRGETAVLPTPRADLRATERWQAELWQRVTRRLGVARQHPFLRFLEQPLPSVADEAASTTHLFALPAIPPLQLALLERLAHLRPIHLWVLNPCREYWFELVDAKRLSWLAARGREHYLETGNRLLAGWGRQTQAHIDQLYSHDQQIVEHASAFIEAADHSLLGALQDAVLDSRELERGHYLADESLEFHVCHALGRQLESLHDRLLALFAAQPTLQPGEVLVVLPDLASAAAQIDGVFGTVPASRRIPYQITGRAPAAENPVAGALLQILALLQGRLPLSEVFALLQQAPVAARFGFDAEDLHRLRSWILATRMRWGLDAAQRSSLALPAEARFTLADGLERLWLAYAIGASDEGFEGSLAAGAVEGSSALALGRFAAFVEALRSSRAAWQQAQPAAAWRENLLTLIEQFIASDFAWAEARRSVHAAIEELCADIAVQETAVPPSVVGAALARQLEHSARGGVPGGGVCFAPLAALRNLPYAVICVLNLDDGLFPSATPAAEFDLVAQLPRRGDRMRRDDERNLLLDLLLAARRHFFMFWNGRSQRDNSTQPPSVLVSELLDIVSAACAPGEAAKLLIEHPLQAFSASLFDPRQAPRLRSYNAEYCAALQQQRSAPAMPTAAAEEAEGDEAEDEADADTAGELPPFLDRALPQLTAATHELALETLLRFLRHPARYLLQEGLGIRLPQDEVLLEDEEPFLADTAAERQLAARLLPALQAGLPEAQLAQRAADGNEFPPGQLGAVLRADCVAELQRFAQRAAGLGAERCAARPFTLSLPLGAAQSWQLHGQLGSDAAQGAAAGPRLSSAGLLLTRFSHFPAADALELWLHHLCLNALRDAPEPPSGSTQSLYLCRKGLYRLAPLAANEARAELATLLTLYRDGQSQLLRFYPRTAWSWINAERKPEAARKAWLCTPRKPWGEAGDLAWRLALRGVRTPLDEDFYRAAEQVFGPLLAHLAELDA